MTKRFLITFLTAASVVSVLSAAGALILAPTPATAQSSAAAAKATWARDFNGVWSPIAGIDITANLLPGEEISLTKFGAEQYNKMDEADSPAYRCEPYGPTRSMLGQGAHLEIFQQEDTIGMIFEELDYRLIYMNGKHPDDIVDYPEWEGHSIGRWDGDTLVVDTIGMREESWLDFHGLQHSGMMHMVERYRKTSPDTYISTVTIDDPVYFTKPFTYAFNVERDNFRIVPNRCEDSPPTGAPGEKYTPTRGLVGPTHRVTPTFPPGVARTYIGADKEGSNAARGRRPAAPMAKKTKFDEDVIKTSRGDLKITSIAHYSLMFTFNGKVIDVDPVGQSADFSLLPKADVILVTHIGPDHMDPATIKLLSTSKTALMVCPHCSKDLSTGTIMINGETQTVDGFKIEAIPAYSIKGRGGNGKANTTKGTANGYVITFGDKRVLVAGETENVPEVKALKQIDIAFLPVNNTGIEDTGTDVILRTMTPPMFTDAVNALRPKIVFPYAYSNNDPKALVALLKDDAGIDVRVRDMK